MKGALRHGNIDLLSPKKAGEFKDANGKTIELGKKLSTIMLPNHGIRKTVKVEKIYRVSERTTCNYNLMMTLKLADHCRKHVDMGRVRDIEPDLHP